MRIVKTAIDSYQNTIGVGNYVRGIYIDQDTKEVVRGTIVSKVIRIHHQGRDGTILTTEEGLNPNYPNHKSERAKNCRKVLL